LASPCSHWTMACQCFRVTLFPGPRSEALMPESHCSLALWPLRTKHLMPNGMWHHPVHLASHWTMACQCVCVCNLHQETRRVPTRISTLGRGDAPPTLRRYTLTVLSYTATRSHQYRRLVEPDSLSSPWQSSRMGRVAMCSASRFCRAVTDSSIRTKPVTASAPSIGG
jgi:hypothetical protein